MNTRAIFHVSPHAEAGGDGSSSHPFATPREARNFLQASGLLGVVPVTVILGEGTHYLDHPLVFAPEDSGTGDAPVVWKGVGGGRTILSGGRRLACRWTPHGEGIYKSPVEPGTVFDSLFVNGERQILARYPNMDPGARCFDGTAADAFSKERAARWKHPEDGFLHAMHPGLWGDFHYRITGVDEKGALKYEGGWQNNRPARPHESHRFVEGLFEELDAPGEWFLDRREWVLYFYPPKEMDLSSATVEVAILPEVVSFRGTSRNPVHHLHLEDLVIANTARTFMETRDPLLRGDWCIYRGGACFLTGVEHLSFERVDFNSVGGNGFFASGYCRGVDFTDFHIKEAGASAVCFVGELSAVRNPLLRYEASLPLEAIDPLPGPQGPDYPADCRVENGLISRPGRFEKQTAGVEIAMASRITVKDLTIHGCPRAAVNINDGCWGGHRIEGCDLFDTVRETSDHGSFNAWGRDRFWHPNRGEMEKRVAIRPELSILDAVEATVIRRNRFRCDHGWDIDLDDGASHYVIEENLCLAGGIKCREGFRRTVRGNIMVANSFHPHVWFENSGDHFENNIVSRPYFPIRLSGWGECFDRNFLHAQGAPGPARELMAASGMDGDSRRGDARFVDPVRGEYRVAEDSPAVACGFVNFPMGDFGVKALRLRPLAPRPGFPLDFAFAGEGPGDSEFEWLGMKVRPIRSLAEASAAGLHEVRGVRLESTAIEGRGAESGLRPGDVILSIEGKPVGNGNDLESSWRSHLWRERVTLGIWRDQGPREIVL